MLAKVGSKDTETVVNALIKHAQKLPQELYQSLTWNPAKVVGTARVASTVAKEFVHDVLTKGV